MIAVHAREWNRLVFRAGTKARQALGVALP